MPMNALPVAGETESLLSFLDQQRRALRNAAYGLTDEQARARSTASSLSVGGLVKHVARAEKNWVDKIVGCDETDPGDYAAYLAGFRMEEDETLSAFLDLYAETAARTGTVVTGIADLGRDVDLPKGVPWFPGTASVRWILLHLIEETVRHAGHADIIREGLDGASAGALMAAVEGWEPTAWVTPWTPESASVS
jgi:uncharacterized damage-inducible protein DinB